MKKYYEWVKATPDNLPKDGELVCVKTDGGGCDHYQTGDAATLEYECSQYKPELHAFPPEYLAEVEQTWPTDEQIDKGAEENVKYRDKDWELFDFYFRVGIEWAINFFKQQVGNNQ
jgi:hypothetical protein